MKKVLVSIVNGSRFGYIYPCVDSIINHTKNISYDIIVIDNNTGDENLNMLEKKGVTVIVNNSPMGFSENHAQILKFLDDYEYFLIFNDDAFFENDVISLMVSYLDSNECEAIVGPKIQDPDGELQPTAAQFPTLEYFVKNSLGLDKRKNERYSKFFLDSIDYSYSQKVDWVSGCCMLIRGDFVRNHGFLDTGYFMFLEDADLCKRARLAGKGVYYLSDALVTHYRGGSSKGGGGGIQPFLFVETHFSRLRYLKKQSLINYAYYAAFLLAFIPLRTFSRAVRGDWKWSKEVWESLYKRSFR